MNIVDDDLYIRWRFLIQQKCFSGLIVIRCQRIIGRRHSNTMNGLSFRFKHLSNISTRQWEREREKKFIPTISNSVFDSLELSIVSEIFEPTEMIGDQMEILARVTSNENDATFIRLSIERFPKGLIADFTTKLNTHSTGLSFLSDAR